MAGICRKGRTSRRGESQGYEESEEHSEFEKHCGVDELHFDSVCFIWRL